MFALELHNSIGTKNNTSEESYRDFEAAVLRNDGFLYGILDRKIIKFSPPVLSKSNKGRNFKEDHTLEEAVLAEDGNIYDINN